MFRLRRRDTDYRLVTTFTLFGALLKVINSMNFGCHGLDGVSVLRGSMLAYCHMGLLIHPYNYAARDVAMTAPLSFVTVNLLSFDVLNK
jgi:hypothetical protein